MRSQLPALALIAAVCGNCLAVRADTGAVVFSTGHATLVDGSGKTIRLAKGQAVGAGDLLRTMQGRLQLRFPDGTYASMPPGSDLRIDAYRYSAQPDASNTAFFTLYRGGVRFMTGSIAESLKGRFRLNTPFGTLNAGGAEFSAVVGEGLQISVGAGSAEVRNQAGALRLTAGERGFVRDRSAPPVLIGTIVPAPVTPR